MRERLSPVAVELECVDAFGAVYAYVQRKFKPQWIKCFWRID